MTEIKIGSNWQGTGDHEKVFTVIHLVESDGHTWVHYRNNDKNAPAEYSCYVESFLDRFRERPE
jgi:Neuraminidase (sialidase)